MKSTFVLSLALACCAGTTNAYDVNTHAMLTYQAYLQSDLNKPALLESLGIDYFRPNKVPFGERYFDVKGTQVEKRTHHIAYEDSIINFLRNEKDGPQINYALDLPAWLMRGAVREDDGSYALDKVKWVWTGEEKQPRKGDDPYPLINRYCNHFFDPTKPLGSQAGSFYCPVRGGTITTAINWALGVDEAFASTPSITANRLNHFTLVDTKEAIYRAVVGKSSTGAYLAPNNTLLSEPDRKTYWASAFRSLGDILHLLEDMGQPQHTRDEPHAGIIVAPWLGDPIYEKYTGARVVGASTYKGYSFFENGSNSTAENLTPPTYTGYPIPKFKDYRDFWSSGVANFATGKGLADYSNRGFLTISNNIGHTNYKLPSPYARDYPTQDFTFYDKDGDAYVRTYLTHTVKDYNTGVNAANVKAVTYGAFYQYDSSNIDQEPYLLDRHVFDDMARLNIPRAVAYAAGLINHLFRGKIDITPPEGGVYGIVDHATLKNVDMAGGFSGFGAIKVKLKNTTPDNEAMPNGTLVAVLKFKRNYCYTGDLKGYLVFPKPNGNTPYDPNHPAWKCRIPAGAIQEPDEEIVLSDSIANVALSGAAQEFKFNFTRHLPINATDVRLQIVYRGQLGVEPDAVVVASKDISEPTFYTQANTFNILDFKGNAYSVDQFNASQTLLHSLPSSYINDKTNPHSFDTRPLLGTESIASNMRFGTNGPVVSVPALRYGEFFRIALLSNAGESIQTTVKDCGGSDEALDIASSTYQSYITNSPIGLYSAYLNFKGQFVSYSLTLCRFTIDSIPYDYDGANNTGGYSGSPPTQVPATITGF